MQVLPLNHIHFVGLGGAGQRHLRVLRKLLPAIRFSASRTIGRVPMLNADFSLAPEGSLAKAYDLEIISNLAEALAGTPDLVVIANPTSLHLGVMEDVIKAGAGILVEKPWSQSVAGFPENRRITPRSRLMRPTKRYEARRKLALRRQELHRFRPRRALPKQSLLRTPMARDRCRVRAWRGKTG